MTKLTAELKAQHEDITIKLNKVLELGSCSEEGQQLLLIIKETLIAHLQKEDRELYPALQEATKTDDQLKRTMEKFAQEMESISKLAKEFFTKYSNGGSGTEFSRDFGRLVVVLGGRISKEEKILYTAYDKIAAWYKENYR